MGYQPSQKTMELQYHVYKKLFRSGWVIKDSKSAVLYSINAKHLHKHEVSGKRIVASMKHDTEEGYSIHLEDEDKTFATYRYSGDLSREYVYAMSFELDGQKFRWDVSLSPLPSRRVNEVGRFDHITQYSIAKVGCLRVRLDSPKIAAILATFFFAQKVLGMSGSTLVLSKLTDEDSDEPGEKIYSWARRETESVTAQRRRWETESALSALGRKTASDLMRL